MRVVSENARLPKTIANLPSTITEPETGIASVYAGYVSSKLLDATVNSERTDFGLPDVPEEGVFETIGWSEIDEAVTRAASDYLVPFTKPILEQKMQRIEQFVQTDGSQYRHLLHHRKNALHVIPADAAGNKLDLELYKLSKDFEIEVRQNGHQIVEAEAKGEEGNLDEHKKKFDRFLEESNDVGKANLAKYVVHRRSILSLFEERLRKRADGKYPLEESIHKIVFPLKTLCANMT